MLGNSNDSGSPILLLDREACLRQNNETQQRRTRASEVLGLEYFSQVSEGFCLPSEVRNSDSGVSEASRLHSHLRLKEPILKPYLGLRYGPGYHKPKQLSMYFWCMSYQTFEKFERTIFL